MKYPNPFLLFILPAALAAGLLLTACSDDGTSNPTTSTPDTTRVRVMHTGYDAPAVAAFFNGSATTVTNLAYGNASAYLDVEPGTLKVALNAAGSGSALVNLDMLLRSGRNYTAYAIGGLNTPISGVYTEDERPSKDSTTVKLRIVQAVPDAPLLDFCLDSLSGNVIAADLAFREASFYVDMPAGARNFFLAQAGDSTALLSYMQVLLEPREVYSLVLTGTLTDTDSVPFEARLFRDSSDGSEMIILTPDP